MTARFDDYIGRNLAKSKAQNVSMGLNPDGSPIIPAYTSGLDMNPAFQELQAEALRPGESKWTALARQKQALGQRGEEDAAAANAAGQAAQGISSLQRTGGSTAGSRERMVTALGKTAMAQQEDIANRGASNSLQLSMNDQQNKLSNLGTVSGINMQEAGNINEYNKYEYGIEAGKYGGKLMAQATRDAGSGGSWLCTEASHALSKEDIRALSKLRRYAMRKDKAKTQFYIYDCERLVKNMKISCVDWSENTKFVRVVAELAKAGDMQKAYEIYVDVVRSLIDKYWPECNNSVYLEGV